MKFNGAWVNRCCSVLSFLFCWVIFTSLPLLAERVNTGFLPTVPTQKYRLVSHADKAGAVCIGALHGSSCIVYYLPEGESLTDDCYWFVETENGKWRFRNAATGQYLVFTPAKDYETYTRLLLSDTPDERALWDVELHGGALCFSYTESDVAYYIGVSNSSPLVESSKGYGNGGRKQFSLCDEAGASLPLPAVTPFVQYVDSLRFDEKLVPFDGQRWLYPLPESLTETDDFRPRVDFRSADDADYALRLSDIAAGSDGLVFPADRMGSPFTLSLFRNGEEVCRGDIELTNHPVVEINVENPERYAYHRGTLRLTDRKSGTRNGLLAADFRHRGATSMNYPKRSFAVKLMQADGADLDSALLDIRHENSWILDAMAIDGIRMRNRVCFDLWNRFSPTPYATSYNRRNGTEGRFVEVILNGEYNGLYCLTDKIDRKLLNLKKPKAAAGGDVTVRGLLYKSNSWDHTGLHVNQLDLDAPMDTDEWNKWELQVPDDYPSPQAWNPLLELYELCSSSERFVAEFDAAFYRQNVIDFYVFVLAFNMVDNGNKNLFLSTPDITKSARFLLTPWDMDATIGGAYDGRYSEGTYDELAVADARIHANNPFHRAWRSDVENFRQQMADRWFELHSGVLSPDSVVEKMETYAAEHLRFGTWRRELARWTKGTPVVQDLLAEIDYLRDWYERRCVKMEDYFRPYSTGIATIPADSETAGGTKGIYSLTGLKLADDAAALSTLPAGVYVVDGRKVLK